MKIEKRKDFFGELVDFKIYESRYEIGSEQLELLYKAARKKYPTKEPLMILRRKLTIHPDDLEAFFVLFGSKTIPESYSVVTVDEKGSFFYGHYELSIESAFNYMKDHFED